ncbi:MAG: chaperonin GroEL, partial [Defluviicoccus sp.]|nr:chaperonin GroEL [Defluviicoccus sp.]
MTASYPAFGLDSRRALYAGVRVLADAVRVTLGPAGRAVLIEEGGKPPRVTADGARVAQSIELADRFADMGARLVRNAAARTAEEAGDGRTAATVIAAAMIGEGIKAVAAGADPAALKRGIDEGTAAVLDVLREAARPVEAGEALAKIATLAANGDAEIGRVVAQAVAATGAEGVVDVEDGHGRGVEYEIVTGVRFDEGYVSPYFMTDPETLLCTYDEPLILLHDGKLDRHEPLLGLLEAAVRMRRPLAIVAETVEGEALRTLTANKVRGGLRLVAAKAPHFGDRRRAALEDAAVLTGATVIAEDKGLALRNAGPGFLGGARRTAISGSETLFVDGAGDEAAIEDRRREIRNAIAAAGTGHDRKLLTERLARLSGGVASIRIGGDSEAEIAIRSERARTAARAARAAISNGAVPGGGAALLHA